MKSEIKWLLTESDVSRYRIWQRTGIAQSTLSDYATGKTDLGRMPLETAETLYQFYLELTEVVDVESISQKDDYPIDGEAYAILTDGKRYAFAWGPEYPYAEEVPSRNIESGESGIMWFSSETEARNAMSEANEAWNNGINPPAE